ncbi:MAG: DUF4405 domain-containing protein [Verrucomicrobiia bacterium]
MNIKREWVTPITTGAFLLSAATGILLFFHMNSGAIKVVHEWLSWILVGGVALHMVPNFRGLKTCLSTKRGTLIVGAFAAILAVVIFLPAGKHGEPPFMQPIRALSQAPLTTLAQVAQIPPQQLLERLAKAGLQPVSDQQKLSELTGDDMRKQLRVLSLVLSENN